MERSVSVNAMPIRENPEEFDSDVPADSAPVAAQNSDQGPCLYLGPAGQRCARRALEGGFCLRHKSGSRESALSSTQIPRRTIAIIALLAALLPFLADLMRELLRLFR
jgi:hypothetical protein